MKVLLAAGTGAAGLAAPTAQGAIVYSGVIDKTATNASDGLYINMSTFAIYYLGGGGEHYNFAFFDGHYVTPFILGTGWVTNALSAGTPVQTQPFDMSLGASGGFGSTPGYLGVEFRDGGSGGPLVYGWLEYSYDGGGFTTIYDAAYNSTPGGAIDAGQTAVPEPGESAWVGAMVAGSVAAFAARKRRREKRAA
jgi:hypothetical protein